MKAAVVVPCAKAQSTRELLERHGFWDKTRKLQKRPDNKVLIPIIITTNLTLPHHHLPEAKYLLDVIQADLPPSKAERIVTPAQKLLAAVGQMLDRCDSSSSSSRGRFLMEEVPNHWEKHGDLVLLPVSSFSSAEWDLLGRELWQTVAECTGSSRVAYQSVVSADGFRTPQVKLQLGDNALVQHIDNAITYEYDLTRCMFSAGNISEKLRIAGFRCAGETVVDLYAGIGYFTLPYLVHAGATHVHACEWNPDAVAALRRNLKLNCVHTRCTVHPGDNRQLTLRGVADRVNLGLIPSSEEGWPVACRVLKPTGGILHIHGNVNTQTSLGERHPERTDSERTHSLPPERTDSLPPERTDRLQERTDHVPPERTDSLPERTDCLRERTDSLPPERTDSLTERTDYVSPERTHSLPERTHSLPPERTDSLPERTDSLPERTDSLWERTHSLPPERTDSLPERTHSLPERTDSLRERTHSLPPERTDSLPERTDSLPPERTDSLPERTDCLRERTDYVPPERTHSLPERTDSERTDSLTERTDSLTERTDSERTDSLPERTDSLPERTDSLRERTDYVPPERTDSLPERTDSERTDSLPERTDSLTERTDSERTDSLPERTDSLRERTDYVPPERTDYVPPERTDSLRERTDYVPPERTDYEPPERTDYEPPQRTNSPAQTSMIPPGTQEECSFPRPCGKESSFSSKTAAWQKWGEGVCRTLESLLEKEHGGCWRACVLHIENVKSYAPHINHLVLDVRCTPDNPP